MTELKPSLDLSDVMRIARQAAAAETAVHEVVGVSVGSRGSDYVEILVTTQNAGGDSSLFVVGAFRNVSEASFRRDITSRLRQRRGDLR
jgi:hypothetical protein